MCVCTRMVEGNNTIRFHKYSWRPFLNARTSSSVFKLFVNRSLVSEPEDSSSSLWSYQMFYNVTVLHINENYLSFFYTVHNYFMFISKVIQSTIPAYSVYLMLLPSPSFHFQFCMSNLKCNKV